MKQLRLALLRTFVLALILIAGSAALTTASITIKPSPMEKQLQLVAFEQSATIQLRSGMLSANLTGLDSTTTLFKRKSPGKAFLLSLAVPGLGQWYYGSRVKPFLFLGVELSAWGLHAKWHRAGEDATRAYESFANRHWSEEDYTAYLERVYGVSDDDDEDIQRVELSHHLPDEKIQQYYEMIGKYDQFSWGWDDAWLDSSGVAVYDPWQAVTGGNTVPQSDNRDTYEGMRDDANNQYAKATNMIFVSMVNRLASAFEAYFVTKAQNRKGESLGNQFSRISVRATLASYNEPQDTPFVKVAFRF